MARRAIALLLTTLFVLTITHAQERHGFNLAEEQKAPTVLGGTGLFNTFSTRTLCKGEFNFALFWNNYSRDPGDLSINQVPFNFTIGLTNRWEMWGDWNVWTNTTSRQPFLLSGYQLSASGFFGKPFVLLGPPVGGTDKGAAFFPGSGSAVGGILPPPGRFGTPIGFPTSAFSPAPGKFVRGLGPAIAINTPSYNPEIPFFGELDFQGFDSSGNAVFGPRESSNGSGDFTVGTKFSLIDPNHHLFSLALGGYLKLPISTGDSARARGRTSGELEFGPILMLGQESGGKRFRLYENIGYIHTTDPSEDDIKILDLPDKLLMNIGMSVAINKHAEFVTELLHTQYVGNRTPNLATNSPTDLNIGLRFYFMNGAISFGGAYRRFLSNEDDITLPVFVSQTSFIKKDGITPQFFVINPFLLTTLRTFESKSGNGFVGYFSIGSRKHCPPLPAPTCVLKSSAPSVNKGERLTLATSPTTPGYDPAKVTYEYKWMVTDGQGRPVTVSGAGASVEVATSSLACGRYSVITTVLASVPAVDCPSDCVTTGQTTCTAGFEITEPECPKVSCQITASPSGYVKEGDTVTLTATSTGADNPTYTWSTTDGRLSSTTGPSVTLDTTGAKSNTPILVSVEVSTDHTRCEQRCPGNKCTIEIPSCPTLSCKITASTMGVEREGDKVQLTATSTGADNPIYKWTKSTGSLSSDSGPSVTLDTTGVSAGTRITVTVTVTTANSNAQSCSSASCELEIVWRSCELLFRELKAVRIDNTMLACVESSVLEMGNLGPPALILIDTHRDSSEPGGISLTRANNLRSKLIENHELKIDKEKIQIRNFSDTCPVKSGDPTLNRRMNVWIFKDTADPSLIKPQCADGTTAREVFNEEPWEKPSTTKASQHRKKATQHSKKKAPSQPKKR